jgi:hypothetical protein
MAIQSARRANAFTVDGSLDIENSLEDPSHRRGSPKNCTDSQKWIRACFAYQHQRAQDENNYEEITSSSIVRCPSFMAEAFSPSCWIVVSTRRSIHAASAEPGDRGRLWGV